MSNKESVASLSIKNIYKRYESVEVLKGIDIHANPGEFLVLVGPSGCGKSTLLNIIAGLDRASEGDIMIGDRVVNDTHPKDRDIAMVFQSYALYPTMKVRDNISFGLEMRGVPKAERLAAVARVAKLLQIEHLLDRKPGQLSGGQRQRVAMGRALVRNPAIFLFDEPLSNLDAKLRVEMRTEIKKLHQRLGTTIVYVTHDQIEAMTLATRIAVMKDGVVQQFADPQTVYEKPANLFVAGFIGSPSMNFIKGRLRKNSGQSLISLMADNSEVTLPLPMDKSPMTAADKEIILGLRPENITEFRPADANLPGMARFNARVEVLEPTGPDIMTLLSLGGNETTARVRPGTAAAPGQRMEFMADMSKAVLFDPSTGARL